MLAWLAHLARYGDVEMASGTPLRPVFDALQGFWPGLLALVRLDPKLHPTPPPPPLSLSLSLPPSLSLFLPVFIFMDSLFNALVFNLATPGGAGGRVFRWATSAARAAASTPS